MHPLPLILPFLLATLLGGCLSPDTQVSHRETLITEGVEWKRSASGCLNPQRCAAVQVRYQHFTDEPRLTMLTERQLGRLLVSLTQPYVVLPNAGADIDLVDDSAGRYLADSYAEGDVHLVSQVLRADDRMVVIGLQGTLTGVSREASEMQYMVFDREQQRLLDPAELVLPGKLADFKSRLAALAPGHEHVFAALSAAPLDEGMGVKFRDPYEGTQFDQVTIGYDQLKGIINSTYIE